MLLEERVAFELQKQREEQVQRINDAIPVYGYVEKPADQAAVGVYVQVLRARQQGRVCCKSPLIKDGCSQASPSGLAESYLPPLNVGFSTVPLQRKWCLLVYKQPASPQIDADGLPERHVVCARHESRKAHAF
jgi:hypothetical protein